MIGIRLAPGGGVPGGLSKPDKDETHQSDLKKKHQNGKGHPKSMPVDPLPGIETKKPNAGQAASLPANQRACLLACQPARLLPSLLAPMIHF